ncbi:MULTISPECIES: DUF1540 domain-containing protein [Bacillales]|jgi:hypothetical protein|uniref:DUF1540 domain-containing protein n=1 Tax=Brevibacillus aydinogluensis TaxID=927786 RepID=A0AA48RDB1_9BACL|nr:MULTISPECIES: DUF1540 domain-containing protein [Bacillales]REK61307.1 MAG: DUF1540 domain-containing protein [Brevibacillus sp.]MBR8660880.1 DUF1540 domain-containing protein [Brevibacillus sp. NL20B1]MDT3416908.1 hypothetical protein [Brevibacillus aydinogluensis]NNV04539.1 DUF1540 domain-containing protein [Brevibacillus sp. MCWH]UFJ61392.1 DUF1540 domain-containing protein [Anoxybacillus sediminis]
MPIVKCSVSNCEYWSEGNNCSAEMIMVEIDSHAHANFKEEFAGEYGHDSQHKDQVNDSSQTCCHTFKPKKDEKK